MSLVTELVQRWRRPKRPAVGRVRRLRAVAKLGGSLLAARAALLGALVLKPLPRELREERSQGSLRVTDRDDALLQEVRADDGARARWVSLDDCGPAVTTALLAAEDRHFFRHPGIDPFALARSLLLDVKARRVVSGGSTLTMQLARTVRPHRRTFGGKLLEMILALRIEASLTKREILEQYLNRVSFGPNLRGIAATSHAYFDKPPRALSTSEAALLVGMARGPSYYELKAHADRAAVRRDRVLSRMLAAGNIAPETYERARAEPIVLQRNRAAFGAPHLVRALVSGTLSFLQPGLGDALGRPYSAIETSIDAVLQRTAEASAARVTADLARKHVTAASVVVLDNDDGGVLAYVGSPDFFDVESSGANDGVRAARQPGSTLKPFLYGLAMERLGFTGATVLPDIAIHVPTPSGDYAPHDYDERTRGPVRLREALGSSLNVPAVWTAEEVGGTAFLDRLHALGFTSLDQLPEYYGPGLALGDGEVTLLELTQAYAVLARGGIARPLRFVRAVHRADGDEPEELAPGPTRSVLPEAVAAQITDILRDHDARRLSFGEHTLLDFDFDVAVKTGTSKGYRDNWVVGYTRQVTVGVWVGNFDGSPMNGTSGITGAGPLFHAVMDAAMQGRPDESLAIDGHGTRGDLRRVEVCALSGEIPGAACSHRVLEWMPASAADALPACTMHERVRVDRRNGLRAGPACTQADTTTRDVERFPPEYAAWAQMAGRPVLRESSPFCPASDTAPDDGASLRIADLADGARFAIDPERPRALQRLGLEVVAPDRVRSVRLRVDGQVLAERGAPYEFTWPLEEGEHVLVAEADGAPSSPPLRVHVRGP